MRSIILIFLIIILKQGFSQDIVKVMQYNLLNYGNYTSYCSVSNNSQSTKNQYLKIIIDNTLPDIFTVNEMGAQNSYAIDILNNCLNVNGRSWYNKAAYTNSTGSNIVNMLFYDNRKFTLYSQDIIYNSLRDINVYHLYYNSPDITNLNDTAYISCLVAHLKAGNTQSDENERYSMAQSVMQYISDRNIESNYLLMGDFNLYTSTEPAMQEFINYSSPQYVFNDPVNQLGDWNNNSSFSNYHTQSTHTIGDCPATGGLDDRFDFILMSNYIKNNTAKVSYSSESYMTYGQDGNHFNKAVNSPTNTAVTSTIADALYNMSDHLPVIMQLDINQTPAMSIEEKHTNETRLKIINPAYEELQLEFVSSSNEKIDIDIYSLIGRKLINETLYFEIGKNYSKIDINKLSKGIYLLILIDEKGNVFQNKFIKL